jgi:hypothetical protein
MAPADRRRASVTPLNGALGDTELRDAEGLLLDEYTSAAYGTPDALDALDVPFIRLAESVLESLPAPEEEVTGLVELEQFAAEEEPAEMGLGAEPHSADELAEAALGHELGGPRGVTRESQLHGERLLDAPDTMEA